MQPSLTYSSSPWTSPGEARPWLGGQTCETLPAAPDSCPVNYCAAIWQRDKLLMTKPSGFIINRDWVWLCQCRVDKAVLKEHTGFNGLLSN